MIKYLDFHPFSCLSTLINMQSSMENSMFIVLHSWHGKQIESGAKYRKKFLASPFLLGPPF